MAELKTYKVLGVMSGTSLDGMDLALCEFENNHGDWNFRVLQAETYAYSKHWYDKLSNAKDISALELTKLDYDYGAFLGEVINDFLLNKKLDCDFISSHGHTVYHNPNENYTLQIGKGAAICAKTSKKVICDFRSTDVSLGGQGAPLVPMGDLHLFKDFDTCLNLGGFANLSIKTDDGILAYDIAPCNVLLNHLSMRLNEPYDKNGHLAQKGKLISSLLNQLNDLSYYSHNPPKSLGIEWVEDNIITLDEWNSSQTVDLLHTVTEHIAEQIALEFIRCNSYKILVTGGGAHNHYLLNKIRKLSNKLIEVPDKETVDFKEAIIFGFLGLLRYLEQPNTLRSVTGATKDSIGGCIYIP